MNILNSDEPQFTGGYSIFLAGPTPRTPDVPSWRPKALEILEKLGFPGTVLVPERREWTDSFDYMEQVQWERSGLRKATVIAFWVPRDMQKLPGLTTNVEFGYWFAQTPGRIVYGRPKYAPHCRYLDYLYQGVGKPKTTLLETMRAAAAAAEKRQQPGDRLARLEAKL